MLLANYKGLIALTCASLLVACGGGSSDDPSSPAKASPKNTGGGQTSDKYNTVKGVYDTTAGNNKQYYFIGADGILTAYNYLGDGFDAGDNCYRESSADEANGAISGVKLKALESGDFSIAVGSNEVLLEMSGNQVTKVSASGLSAGGTLALKLDGIQIRITSNRAADVTIDDIEGMLCQ